MSSANADQAKPPSSLFRRAPPATSWWGAWEAWGAQPARWIARALARRRILALFLRGGVPEIKLVVFNWYPVY